jgi:hypothetical protein
MEGIVTYLLLEVAIAVIGGGVLVVYLLNNTGG